MWRLDHLTTIDFRNDPPVDVRDSAACETVDIDPVDASRRWIHTREPQGSILDVGIGNVPGGFGVHTI